MEVKEKIQIVVGRNRLWSLWHRNVGKEELRQGGGSSEEETIKLWCW